MEFLSFDVEGFDEYNVNSFVEISRIFEKQDALLIGT